MLQRHYRHCGNTTAVCRVGLKALFISGFFSRFLSSTWIDNVDLESRDDQPQAKSEKRTSFLDVANGAAHPTGNCSLSPLCLQSELSRTTSLLNLGIA
jgi:hypothetical protein